MPIVGKIELKREDVNELLDGINKLPDKLRKKALKKGITKATQPIAKAVRAAAPKRTGFLAKSYGHKVRAGKNGGVYGMVGPRRGYEGLIAIIKTKGRRKTAYVVNKKNQVRKIKAVGIQQGKKITPWRYAHLVEAKKPHLEPTFEAQKSQAIKTMAEAAAVVAKDEFKKLSRG